MKKILILLLLSFSIAAIALSQKKKVKKAKQQEAIAKVEYKTFTRGSRTEVTVAKDTAISTSRGAKKYVLITGAKWNEIWAALKKVPLTSISTLKAPTNAREYDGAAHSRIIISTKKSAYKTGYFDEGQPMQQLKALYEVIYTIRNAISTEGKPYPQ